MKQAPNTSQTYDAVIVLGTNIRKDGNIYRPTTYDDYDQYGMLGGDMSVLAASLMCEQQVTDTFVFSTGTSEKTKAIFGPGVPTEAKVYSEDFMKRIKEAGLPKPTVILEDRSVNTYTNLVESFAVIREKGWSNVAIMSPRYHIPRVEQLVGLVTIKHPIDANLAFIKAEDIVITLMPGHYEKHIEAAYNSPQAKKRQRIEQQGIDDIKNGRYVISEFQLDARGNAN